MCGSHRRRHDHRWERVEATRERAPERAESMRASDDEREAVAVALRDHAAAGRLDVPELEQRLESAYAALTHGDLGRLTADLPRAPRRADPQPAPGDLWTNARAWLAVSLLLVVIWAVTGAGYFWPIWPFLGWGIGVLSHAGGRQVHRRTGITSAWR